SINLVGSVVGPTVLRLRARLDDGSEMSATSSIAFATPTGLHVTCSQALLGGYADGAPYGQCGGHSPVFTNSSWRWTFSFDSDAGPLPVYNPSITVQGSAVTFDDTNDWFQSGATDGTAEVVIASRLFAEDVPVKVVLPADVVSGEVRLVTLSDGIEQPIADLGPAPTRWYPIPHIPFDGDDGTQMILPRLTLADGTEAYGGGGLFTSDHPEICYFYANPQDQTGGFIQETALDPQCYRIGEVSFSAMIGAASITWPVTVEQPSQ
ncbi:MAG TPA: hypothetical protein VGP64_16760, partial [Polyangia bacterium]